MLQTLFGNGYHDIFIDNLNFIRVCYALVMDLYLSWPAINKVLDIIRKIFSLFDSVRFLYDHSLLY